MVFCIFFSSTIDEEPSQYDPQESPIKDPRMQPNDLSSNEPGFILSSILAFLSDSYVFIN